MRDSSSKPRVGQREVMEGIAEIRRDEVARIPAHEVVLVRRNEEAFCYPPLVGVSNVAQDLRLSQLRQVRGTTLGFLLVDVFRVAVRITVGGIGGAECVVVLVHPLVQTLPCLADVEFVAGVAVDLVDESRLPLLSKRDFGLG